MTRQSMTIGLILILFTPVLVLSMELGKVLNSSKDNQHVGLNPGIADGRQGGEDIATAIPIDGLPFNDTGNTSDNVDDYDEICPYNGSTSPDVVYSYTPLNEELLTIDLCGSSFDTKVYVWDSAMYPVACNDDFYYDDQCGDYVSRIEAVSLMAEETYYIIIDGYGGDSGDYTLSIYPQLPPPFCSIECNDDEGEPDLVDGYYDAFNNGCANSPNGINFSEFIGDGAGELEFGARSGWFIDSGGVTRQDMDWYTIIIGPTGVVEWTLDAEQETYGAKLGPNNCTEVAVVERMLNEPCIPMTMTIEGTAGELVWLRVWPRFYYAPYYFIGFEYNYLNSFTGLMEGSVSVDNISFSRIKSLYR